VAQVSAPVLVLPASAPPQEPVPKESVGERREPAPREPGRTLHPQRARY